MVDGLLQKSNVTDQLREEASHVARTHFVTENELRSMMVAGFKNAAASALANDHLSEEDDQKLSRLQSSLDLKQDELGDIPVRIAKAGTLRDVEAGLIRSHLSPSSRIRARKLGF
jgi:hypothetical protein